MSYQTMCEAGYEYVKYNPETKEHILKFKETGELEVFVSNKFYSGWAIKYKNTHLEYCRLITSNLSNK